MNEVVIRNSTTQAFSFFGFGCVITVVRLMSEGLVEGIISLGGLVGFFFVAFGTYLFFDRRPQIELSDYGFSDRRLKVGLVPWEAVRHVKMEAGKRPSHVYVETDPNVWGGPKNLKIRVAGLEVPPQRLVRLMTDRVSAVHSARSGT